MAQLTGKVALVTGSSRGLGAAIAREFAARGAAVVLNYPHRREGPERTLAEIARAGGRAVAVKGDVTRKRQIVNLFAQAKKAFGTLDILVNNAGLYDFAPLAQMTEENFHRHFNLNVLGLLLCTQEAVKHFGPKGGVVVNISSFVATWAPPGSVVYNASKGAVDTITKTLARELGPAKIRVVGVAPGLVETDGTAAFMQGDFRHRLDAITPLGRMGLPSDIAPLVAFLASGDASWISGETFRISGGVH